MKIYLPWKNKGFDGRYYQATMTVFFGTTQEEEMHKRAEGRLKSQGDTVKKKKLLVAKKSGKRKCPGHPKKYPIYSKEGQCNICGGFKK